MDKQQRLIAKARLLKDREAFARLVKIHQGRLRAFLLRLTQDTDVADDLSQETFIGAYTKLENYRGDSSFETWLFAIAYREFLQHVRKGNRRLEVTENYRIQQQSLQAWYDSISPQQLDLERAMTKLKPLEAATITLCHSFGASHQDAARILDIPLGTVKSCILRGKDKLRKQLHSRTFKEAAS